MGAGLPKQAPATLQGVWEGQDGASHFRCEIAGSNLKMERHSGAVHTSKSFPVSNWGTNKWSGCFCCCCCSATVAGVRSLRSSGLGQHIA